LESTDAVAKSIFVSEEIEFPMLLEKLPIGWASLVLPRKMNRSDVGAS
jgi:hypothetical protein